MSALLTIAIVGLWAGAVYEPTAIVFLSRQAGMAPPDAAKMASYGTALLSIGTILGCIAAPWLAERLGRRPTLALYYLGMMVTIAAAFGWAFYLPTGTALPAFMTVLFFLGVFGGNFAIFSLWLPELFGTEVRGTAFAFCTSVGRFIGAGVNFGLAAAVAAMGTLGTPIALTAIAFAIGLLVIPFARETAARPAKPTPEKYMPACREVASRTGPLKGLKVFDLTRVLAGPTCVQMLADLGADVVKIERPGAGDDTRNFAPPYWPGTQESAYFLGVNRNKRSVTLDIAKPEGQAGREEAHRAERRAGRELQGGGAREVWPRLRAGPCRVPAA